jgi:hypothetical protein
MYPDAQESVGSLGADIGLEYTKEGSSVLSDYELVPDSLVGENLEKSLTVKRPLISDEVAHRIVRHSAASDSGLEGRRRSRFGVVAFVARG